MPFNVYILYSARADKYYIGHTQNLDDRLYRHRNSGSKFTKFVSDWKLVYTEVFQTRSEPMKRELEIKNKKNRKFIEGLVSSVG